jgi:hypothetical protein
LKNGDVYCSIVRYGEQFAHNFTKGRLVVCNARGKNLSLVLKDVADQFLTLTKVKKPNPIDELESSMRPFGKF